MQSQNMHPNRSEPVGRSTSLLAGCLDGILRNFSAVYLGTRKLKNSAKYRYQARKTPTAAGIATTVSALSKTPNHLSAIFNTRASGEGADSDKIIQDAAELAAWSAVAGIPTISIYDKRGVLKNHAQSLHVFARLRIQEFVPNQEHQIAVYVDGRQSLRTENSDTGTSSISIYLISEDDGRRVVGSIADALAERVRDGEITIDKISLSLLAEQLHISVMPPPDLIVVFGPELKFSGYPPWHLQQAEMETLRDNDEFSYLAFTHALQSFAGAEMRHGK